MVPCRPDPTLRCTCSRRPTCSAISSAYHCIEGRRSVLSVPAHHPQIQSAHGATSDRGVDVAGGEYVLRIDANDEIVHVALDGAEPMRDARRNDDHVARSDPAALTSANRGSAGTRTDQHLHRVAIGGCRRWFEHLATGDERSGPVDDVIDL